MADILGSVQDALETASEEATEFAELLIARAEDAANQLQDSVKEHPLAAVGIVLAIGFVLAMVVTRPKAKVGYARETA